MTKVRKSGRKLYKILSLTWLWYTQYSKSWKYFYLFDSWGLFLNPLSAVPQKMFLFMECTIWFVEPFYDWNVFGTYWNVYFYQRFSKGSFYNGNVFGTNWNVIGFPNWNVEGLLLSKISGLMYPLSTRHKKHKHLKSIQKSIAALHVSILGQGRDIFPDKHLQTKN